MKDQPPIIIRETTAADSETIARIHRAAFGQPDEADLTLALLDDPTASPLLSLLAFDGNTAVGHVLFTRVRMTDQDVLAHILAPLAVVPEHQRHGVGGQLIRAGLQILQQRGSALVFVLGSPEYYPKFGFVPDAAAQGFTTPYALPAEYREAWMVLKLHDANISGRVICADALMQPEAWQG